ncbi:MAG: hypothetical protein FWG61_02405 [Firmicutes bacterium]|nr:hypothetical protein [Bacillota bacterium]
MKYRVLLCIFFIIYFTSTACTMSPTVTDNNTDNEQITALPNDELNMETSGINGEIADDNAAIQWVEPALEALVRQELDKPAGDIFQSDLDYVKTIRLIGETHIAINDSFGSRVQLHDLDDAGKPLKDGTYELDGKQYMRGSISSLADFANFRNVEDIRIYKNDLQDLSGLASLEKLEFLRLSDCSIFSIESLEKLSHINFLDLSSNQITDIEPLCKLEQVSNIGLGNNNITNFDKLSFVKNLQMLYIEYNPIDNIEFIKHLDKLISFGIIGTEVADIAVLAEKPELLSLYLKDMDVERLDLRPLVTLDKLLVLSVSQNRAELLGIQVIGGFKDLKALTIAPNDINISEEDIDWLREQLPHCQIVSDPSQLIVQ